MQRKRALRLKIAEPAETSFEKNEAVTCASCVAVLSAAAHAKDGSFFMHFQKRLHSFPSMKHGTKISLIDGQTVLPAASEYYRHKDTSGIVGLLEEHEVEARAMGFAPTVRARPPARATPLIAEPNIRLRAEVTAAYLLGVQDNNIEFDVDRFPVSGAP